LIENRRGRLKARRAPNLLKERFQGQAKRNRLPGLDRADRAAQIVKAPADWSRARRVSGRRGTLASVAAAARFPPGRCTAVVRVCPTVSWIFADYAAALRQRAHMLQLLLLFGQLEQRVAQAGGLVSAAVK
jgi:hypothetical protein